MTPIEELSNERLNHLGRDYSLNAAERELARVDNLVKRLVLTGADLSYWHERHTILANLVQIKRESYLRQIS